MSSSSSKAKMTTKHDYDADDDIDDKVLTDSMHEELAEGVTELGSEDENIAYDTDEENNFEGIAASSDDAEANGGDNDGGGGGIGIVDDDGDEIDDEDFDAGKGRKSATQTGDADDDHEEEEEEDEDEDDEMAEDDDVEIKTPPAKKAKKSEAAAAPKPKKASSKSKKPTTDNEKAQARLKKEREDVFKDETQHHKTAAAIRDYVYVAAMQATEAEPNFRALVLKYADNDGPKVAKLARHLCAVESQVNQSITLARRANPKEMEEMIDFVRGAVALTEGSVEKSKMASVCDITKRVPVSNDELVCLRAEHMRDGKKLAKHKVVHTSLRDLVEQLFLAVNLLPYTERMILARLRTLANGSKKLFRDGETTATEAINLLCNDSAKTVAVPEVMRKKIRASLARIDTSARLLGAATAE